MVKFVAVLLQGGFPAQYLEIHGQTEDELHAAAWSGCIGSRYVSRIFAEDGDRLADVYTERSGWLIDPTDESELERLLAN